MSLASNRFAIQQVPSVGSLQNVSPGTDLSDKVKKQISHNVLSGVNSGGLHTKKVSFEEIQSDVLPSPHFANMVA